MDPTDFHCSICGDTSHKICNYCTKDACNNHLCQRCLCCSECCRCHMPTNADQEAEPVAEDLTEAIPSLV